MTDEAARTHVGPRAERKAMDDEKNPDWDQMDVLKDKDHVTDKKRGLQQWGEQGGADRSEGLRGGGPTGNYGEASMGTAERQARIGGLADWAKEGKKGPLDNAVEEEE